MNWSPVIIHHLYLFFSLYRIEIYIYLSPVINNSELWINQKWLKPGEALPPRNVRCHLLAHLLSPLANDQRLVFLRFNWALFEFTHLSVYMCEFYEFDLFWSVPQAIETSSSTNETPPVETLGPVKDSGGESRDQEVRSSDPPLKQSDSAQPEKSTDAGVEGEPLLSPMSLGEVFLCCMHFGFLELCWIWE